MPHVPIFRSSMFEGHSKASLYVDVVEEINWSVGQIVNVLEESSVAENTLVFFNSDNGPWLTYYDLGGSSTPWHDGKITSMERRFSRSWNLWWPDTSKPAVIDDI